MFIFTKIDAIEMDVLLSGSRKHLDQSKTGFIIAELRRFPRTQGELNKGPKWANALEHF